MIFARNGFCEISTAVMGTHLVIKAWGESARQAAVGALKEVRRIEGLMSAFRRSSDVCRLNRHAGVSPVRISPDTMRVLEYAIEVSHMSFGAFNVTAGPLISLWRKSIAGSVLPSGSMLERAMSLSDISSLKLEPDRGRAYLCLRGQSVDLGGIAKGYASDKAMDVFRRFGLRSGLIDIGGNVAVHGAREDGRPWRVGVQSPGGERGEVLGAAEVVDKAVVTSGDYERFCEVGGEKYHHIIDPRTGYPAKSGLRSVTVVADRGLVADAISTAAFVLGPVEGAELIRKTGADAVFVTDSGDVCATRGILDSFLCLAGEAVRITD